jgi:hypothetical protein
MSQPLKKKAIVTIRVGEIRGPRGRCSMKGKLRTNLALPNTAGMTVVKFNVAQSEKDRLLN